MSLADDLWAEILGAPHALAQAGQQAWQTASAVPHNLAALATHPQNYLAQLLQKANTQAGNSLKLLHMAGDPRLPPAVRREAQLAIGASALNFNPGAMGVIKAPGGNWFDNAIEKKLDLLRSIPNVGALLQEHNLSRDELHALPLEKKAALVREQIGPAKSAVNDWVGKQLTNYIRNDLGTERDPVRALAEKGILHYDPAQYGFDRPQIMDAPGVVRETWGFPRQGAAVNPLAKQWETATDLNVVPQHAGTAKIRPDTVAQNPWLSKVDDTAPVYGLANFSHEALGFKHLTDELHNALNPDSGLPPELRLRPEQLKNVSVP